MIYDSKLLRWFARLSRSDRLEAALEADSFRREAVGVRPSSGPSIGLACGSSSLAAASPLEEVPDPDGTASGGGMMPDDKEIRRRIDEAFAFVERVMEHPERYPDEAILFLIDPSEIASVVTKERLRILKELSERGYPSFLDLARSLDRGVSRVRKDLLALERLGHLTPTKSANRPRARLAATGIYIPLFPPRQRRAAHRPA